MHSLAILFIIVKDIYEVTWLGCKRLCNLFCGNFELRC